MSLSTTASLPVFDRKDFSENQLKAPTGPDSVTNYRRVRDHLKVGDIVGIRSLGSGECTRFGTVTMFWADYPDAPKKYRGLDKVYIDLGESGSTWIYRTDLVMIKEF